jgi:hypothetical protein
MKKLMITAAAAALVAMTSAGGASALERWVNVWNTGSSAIWSVRISNIHDGSFGPDLLGGSVIPPGYTTTVEPYANGYCRFDVEITYETGQVIDLWNLNLCELTDIYASDYGYTQIAY